MSALTSLKSAETISGISVVAIIVSKDDLATARDQASYVSRCLHRIENLSELDWEEVNDLCRSIHQTEVLLSLNSPDRGSVAKDVRHGKSFIHTTALRSRLTTSASYPISTQYQPSSSITDSNKNKEKAISKAHAEVPTK